MQKNKFKIKTLNYDKLHSKIRHKNNKEITKKINEIIGTMLPPAHK